MSVERTEITGDVSVGRNLRSGGDMSVSGTLQVGGNLVVEGWLEAENQVNPMKGLYGTLSELRAAYPKPKSGWCALVGATLPAAVYGVKNSSWYATGEQAGKVEIVQMESDVMSDLYNYIDQADEQNEKRIKDRAVVEFTGFMSGGEERVPTDVVEDVDIYWHTELGRFVAVYNRLYKRYFLTTSRDYCDEEGNVLRTKLFVCGEDGGVWMYTGEGLVNLCSGQRLLSELQSRLAGMEDLRAEMDELRSEMSVVDNRVGLMYERLAPDVESLMGIVRDMDKRLMALEGSGK